MFCMRPAQGNVDKNHTTITMSFFGLTGEVNECFLKNPLQLPKSHNPYKIRRFGITSLHCKWNKSFSLINGLGFAVLLLQKLNPTIFFYGETNRDSLILIILF